MSWESVGILVIIFVARCADVTMGVFRILMVVQGRRIMAACLGFFEVMVFLSTMSLVLGGGKSLTPLELIAYCGGFAAGNILGSFLENKLMDSYVLVEIIAEKNESSETLVKKLREAGFGTTTILGEGRSGVRLDIKVICSRKQIEKARTIASEHGGFVFLSDVRGVSGGYFARTKGK